jgi:hypothetical protein
MDSVCNIITRITRKTFGSFLDVQDDLGSFVFMDSDYIFSWIPYEKDTVKIPYSDT